MLLNAHSTAIMAKLGRVESLRLQHAISLDDAAVLLGTRKLDAYLGDYDH